MAATMFKLGQVGLVFGAFLITSGCANVINEKNEQGVQSGEQVLAPFDVNDYPLNKMVCDPFGGNGPTDLIQGLQAQLWYLRSDQPRQNTLAGMFSKGVNSNQQLFFSSVNVPTRLFSAGFPTETGGLVQTDEGHVLVEYFAMRFKGGLRLASEETEGLYELALLSDDGATWKVGEKENELRVVVNNDGDHPTRFGCGDVIEMKSTTQLHVEFDYYQGPRYHIAMIPMWRKVDGSQGQDPQCGKLGNSMYFDYNNNSKPQKAYLDLLARGWKPLIAENYLMPRGTVNPCNDSPAPKITNFQVGDLGDGTLVATWTTDVPATSQLRLVNTATGSETLTTSDNVLRTAHTVVVQGLSLQVTYQVQAISITETFGKGLSEIKEIILGRPLVAWLKLWWSGIENA